MGIFKKFKDWNKNYQKTAKKNKGEKLANLKKPTEKLKEFEMKKAAADEINEMFDIDVLTAEDIESISTDSKEDE